jgi:hypothetical protein
MKRFLASTALVTWLGSVAWCVAIRPAHAASVAPASQTEAAFLDISSDPRAKILIDEVDTGKITPEAHLEVTAGRHKLTLVTLDGARRRTLGFAVEAGQTRKFTVHLAQ